MKKVLAILFLPALLSCHHNEKGPAEVNGDVNPAEIAADTAKQIASENTYEYHKTLTISENLAYEVVGYGGPASNGYFAIVQHSANNKSRTLFSGNRHGTIEDVWLTHLNKSHKAEIIIVIRYTGGNNGKMLKIFAIDDQNNMEYIPLPDDLKHKPTGYNGCDSFYIRGSELIREYPFFLSGDKSCCPTGGKVSVAYKMESKSLEKGK